MPSPQTAAAAELSEDFHGRDPRWQTDLIETHRYRQNLADLGGLEELVVITPSRHQVTLRFGYDTRLAAFPENGQLYLKGGDQSIDLNEFPLSDNEKTKDYVVLGVVDSIAYYTAKHHLDARDRQGGTYEHHFGEDGGEQPLLIYDQVNRRLWLTGGSYRVEGRGIVD